MVSGDVFTLVYLPILQTILKSNNPPLRNGILKDSYTCYRILLASIRNLGRCPCPRCLIPLDRAPNMGRPRDMAQRTSLVRVDDLVLHSRIKAAREMIYMKNYKTDSKVVEDLLQHNSLVPTIVGLYILLRTC